MKNLKSKLRQAGLILSLSLLVSTPLMAGKPGGSDFDAANQAYAAKKYDDAIRIYENLLQEGSLSTSVFYNLGNAYYLKGEIGNAVLEYQRALLLEPNAADVAANLMVLRQSRGLPEPVIPVWQKPFIALGLNTWAWIGFASLLAAMLAVFLRGAWLNFGEHEKCPTRLFHGIVAVSVLVLLLAGGGMMVQTQQLDQQVVMSDGTPLKVSPFADAGDIASLKEGDLVKPLKHYNDFVYVKNPAGQKGWIPVAKLKPVLPTS